MASTASRSEDIRWFGQVYSHVILYLGVRNREKGKSANGSSPVGRNRNITTKLKVGGFDSTVTQVQSDHPSMMF